MSRDSFVALGEQNFTSGTWSEAPFVRCPVTWKSALPNIMMVFRSFIIYTSEAILKGRAIDEPV